MIQVLSLMATHSEVGTGAQRLVQVIRGQILVQHAKKVHIRRFSIYQVACTRCLASVKARVCGKLIFGPWRLFLGSCACGFGPWCLDGCVDP